MNKFNKKCLAVLVSAICVKYSLDSQKTIVYAAEINNVETTENNISVGQDQEVLTDVEQAIVKINSSQEEVIDYITIGAKTVKSTNIQSIRYGIKLAKDIKGENLTQTEIKDIVVNTLKKVIKSFDTINLGEATLEDYNVIAATGVTSSNIVDINGELKGKKCRLSSEVQGYINSLIEAISKINQGKENETNYGTIGIYNVMTSDIQAIRNNIVVAKNKKGSDLSVSEIKEVVRTVLEKIEQAYNDINEGKATIDEYNLIGATGVINENLEEINEYLEGKRFTTLSKVQGFINDLLGRISRINEGTEDVNDYLELGIIDAKIDYISQIRVAIKAAKETKGQALTKLEIVETLNQVLNKIEESFNIIDLGKATLEDYNLLGITGVTDENLGDVNNSLQGKRLKIIVKVQEAVDALVKPLIRINNGEETEDDYTVLGIYDVYSYNIDAVREVIKSQREILKRDLTVSEVRDAVDQANKIIDFFELINSGEAKVPDYEYIGATGVNENNLQDVNDALKNKDYKTLIKVQEAINAIVIPLNNINEGIENLDDYKALSIDGVTQDNLNAVRVGIKVARDKKGSNLTKAEIQSSVINTIKILEAFERINAGEGTLADYELVGALRITVDNMVYVNIQIKGSSFVTIAELQIKIDAVVIVYNAFINISTGNGTIEDYKIIGAVGVTVDNIVYVNLEVKGKNFMTIEEVQARINIVIEVRAAFARINAGEGTIEDYKLVGAVGVTIDNLVYVNLKLIGSSYATIADLQVRIDAVVKVYDALIRINSGNGTLDDYNIIGAVGITVDNLVYVNIEVSGKNYMTLEEIQVKVNIVIQVRAAFGRINAGEGTYEDYKLVGVVGITVDNLVYVNLKLKGSSYLTLPELQVKIDVIVKVYNAFIKVNAGEGSLGDYETIGAVGITVNNLIYVNIDLKGKGYMTIDEIQVRINTVINVRAAFERISLGQGKIADYELIGISGVTIENLVYINIKLKDGNYPTVVEMQAKVNIFIKLHVAFGRINAGEGTIADYDTIGAIGVTVENLVYVNIDLKTKNYMNISDIQIIINNVVKVRASIYRINAGEATIDDYKIVGAVRVTVENLVYINVQIKGSSYTNLNELLEKITSIVNRYEAFERINQGKGTLADYNLIEVNGVDEESLPYVNTNLKGENLFTSAEVQVRVDIVIEIYEAFVKVDVVFEKINEGSATLDDFDFIGITGVTNDNVATVNDALKYKNYKVLSKIQEIVDAIEVEIII